MAVLLLRADEVHVIIIGRAFTKSLCDLPQIKLVTIVRGLVDQVDSKLLFEVLNVDVDGFVEQVDLRSPDIAQQIFLRNNLTGILREEKQQFEFWLTKDDFSITDANRTCAPVNIQVSDL